MGMSISTTMGFENRELMMNSSRNTTPSSESGAVKEAAVSGQNTSVYTNGIPLTAQQYILLAATQITVNNSLKETLKYLRTHAEKQKKEPTFGELWNIMNTENEASEKNPYEGELLDLVIDTNSKNIFAA